MPNFREMYFVLFNELTRTIAALQKAQQQTEKMYITDDSADQLIVIGPDTQKNDCP